MEATRRGARVSLAARSTDKLDALASQIVSGGGAADVFSTDVSEEAQCRRLIGGAIAAQGEIDVLVCNAGLGSATQGDELIDLDVIRKLMNVNFLGAVYPTAAAIPSLRKTRGLIVAVSSLQGLLSFPKSSAYSASKHAMQGYFSGLRVDLRDAGIGVLIVSPGGVATNIHQKQVSRYAGMTMEKIAKRAMSPAVCANLICDAIEARQRDLVMTSGGKLMVKLLPFAPNLVDALVLRSVKRFYR